MGSEFKSIHELHKLLSQHPRWKKMKSILEKGVNFELEKMDEELWQKDIRMAYLRGNLKSALKNEKFLSGAMIKEIEQGCSLILPESKYQEILELNLTLWVSLRT